MFSIYFANSCATLTYIYLILKCHVATVDCPNLTGTVSNGNNVKEKL